MVTSTGRSFVLMHTKSAASSTANLEICLDF